VSSLRVTLDVRAAGAAAGTSFVPLDFTNISRVTCLMAGYPVVSPAAGPAGRQVGAAAAPDHGVQVRSVLLAPGGSAHAWLQVTDALNYPARQCHQDTASYLKHAFSDCAARTGGSNVLMVQPIQAGRARRGTAQ
jgi:Protein of unknown function (DUF4232)